MNSTVQVKLKYFIPSITMALFLFTDVSEAWVNTARNRHTSSSRGWVALKATPPSSSSSDMVNEYDKWLHENNDDCLNYRKKEKFQRARLEAQLEQNTKDAAYASTTIEDLDKLLRLSFALEAARDADLRYGLTSPESVLAWQIVDDIYLSSSATRQIECNVRMVIGNDEASIWDSVQQR